jgi:hypothetical protein
MGIPKATGVITITLGPAIDDTDFKSIETVAYGAAGIAVDLYQETADGVTRTAITPSNTDDATHNFWTLVASSAFGIHSLRITAAQNAAAGVLWAVAKATGVLPFESPRYDINPPLSAQQKLDVNVEADTAATDYGANKTAPATPTNVTDAAAAAAAAVTTAHGTGSYLTATGFATATNITAGVITTVTTLTNAPGDSSGVTEILTRLPDATAGAANGLPTMSATGGYLLAANLPQAAPAGASGLPTVDANNHVNGVQDTLVVTLANSAHGGTSATIVLSATQPIKADVSYWGGYAIAYVNQSGVPVVDLCYINGTTIAGTSTQVAASFVNMFNVAAGSMRLTVASYNQGADNNTILASGTYGNNALLTAVNSRMATFTYTAPPSAATVADAVLDEAAAGHTGVIAVNLDAKVSEAGGGSGLTAQETRDAMKLAPTAGDPAAGSIDKHLDDFVSGSPVNITVEDQTKVVIS